MLYFKNEYLTIVLKKKVFYVFFFDKFFFSQSVICCNGISNPKIFWFFYVLKYLHFFGLISFDKKFLANLKK